MFRKKGEKIRKETRGNVTRSASSGLANGKEKIVKKSRREEHDMGQRQNAEGQAKFGVRFQREQQKTRSESTR